MTLRGLFLGWGVQNVGGPGSVLLPLFPAWAHFLLCKVRVGLFHPRCHSGQILGQPPRITPEGTAAGTEAGPGRRIQELASVL